VFGKNDEKAIMTVSIGGNDPSYFVAYEPANYTTEQLKQFEGTYYSEELSTFYDFIVKNGKLTAVHPRLSDIEFTPIMADVFSGNRFFMGLVQFERNTKKITALKVSSGRVRNLRFEKQQ